MAKKTSPWGFGLSNLGQAAKDVGGWFNEPTPTNIGGAWQDPKAKQGIRGFVSEIGGGGDSGGNVPQLSTQDLITQYVGQYTDAQGNPINAQQVLKDIGIRYPSVLKEKDQNKLRTELQDYATRAGWTVGGGAGSPLSGQATNVLDPMGVQLFWQQTIAPYMSQIAQSQAGSQSQWQDLAKQAENMPGVPAGIRGSMALSDLQQGQVAGDTFRATQEAAANQPHIDQLIQTLANDIRARQAYSLSQLRSYYNLGAQGGQGAGATTGPLLGEPKGKF